jgi:hypothetical protein
VEAQSENLASCNSLAILRNHAPKLHFDSVESLRPATVDDYLKASQILEDSFVAGIGEQLMDGGNSPSGAATDIRLDPLPDLRPLEGRPRTAELLQRFGSDLDLSRAGTVYGRAVSAETEQGVAFLQYWFFYVDNPYPVVAGRHDGDWEFAQLRVTGWPDPDAIKLTHLTLNQHGGPETRPCAGVSRPDIWVAVGSHASYFDGSTHPHVPIADECDGAQCPKDPPDVMPIPEETDSWAFWPGHWGADRGRGTWLDQKLGGMRLPAWVVSGLNKVGDSPASPAIQTASWEAKRCHEEGLRRTRVGSPVRRPRVDPVICVAGTAVALAAGVGIWLLGSWLGSLLSVVVLETGAIFVAMLTRLRVLVHFLGKATWPRAQPSVEVCLAGRGRITIRVRGSGVLLRRIVRVSVLVKAEGRPVALVNARRWRTTTVSVGGHSSLTWTAAGYNLLRQRSAAFPFTPVSSAGSPEGSRARWSPLADLRIRLAAVVVLLGLLGATVAGVVAVDQATFAAAAVLVCVVLVAVPLSRFASLKSFKALGVELDLADEAAAAAAVTELAEPDGDAGSRDLGQGENLVEQVVDLQLLLEAKLAYIAKHIVGLRSTGFWSTFLTIGSLKLDKFLDKEDALAARRLLGLRTSDLEASSDAALSDYLANVRPLVRNIRAGVFNSAVAKMLKKEFGLEIAELSREGRRPDLTVRGMGSETVLVFPAFATSGSYWTPERVRGRARELARCSSRALIVVPPGAKKRELKDVEVSGVRIIELDELLRASQTTDKRAAFEGVLNG